MVNISVSVFCCCDYFDVVLNCSTNWIGCHWNEGFSAMRIADYKNFVRFHIDKSGDLHAWVLGIDAVPSAWRQDRKWRSQRVRIVSGETSADPDQQHHSHNAHVPSKWKSAVRGISGNPR